MATKAGIAQATEVRARAEANFKKEERAREGAKAMAEYQSSGRIMRERMAQLKELRLAKEAAEKAEKVREAAANRGKASRRAGR